MALPTSTTNSAAVGANDTTVLLASVSDAVAGNLIRIENEFMRLMAPIPAAATTPVSVLRGQEGSAQVAHAANLPVLMGRNPSALIGAGDWGQPAAGAPQPVIMPANRLRQTRYYAAAGALSIPDPGNDMMAILQGTVALAMTLAEPSILNDGDRMTVSGNGKAAHTITSAAGFGNVGGTADVVTFKADQAQAFTFVASGGFWNLEAIVAGAATIAGGGLG